MRAVVVLPTPRTPVRIQACGMRPASNAFESVRTIASWPIRSSKVAGRYLRARTRYPAPCGAGAAPRSRPGSARRLAASASLIMPPARTNGRLADPQRLRGGWDGEGRAGCPRSFAYTKYVRRQEVDERPEPELVRAAS